MTAIDITDYNRNYYRTHHAGGNTRPYTRSAHRRGNQERMEIMSTRQIRDRKQLRTIVCVRCKQPWTGLCTARRHLCPPCVSLAAVEQAASCHKAQDVKAARQRSAKAAKCEDGCEFLIWCTYNLWLCPGVKAKRLEMEL